MLEPPANVDRETWIAFYQHRINNKYGPMTELAQRIMLKKLSGFRNPKASMEAAITGNFSECKEWASSPGIAPWQAKGAAQTGRADDDYTKDVDPANIF